MNFLFCAALWPAKNSMTLKEGDNDCWVTVSVLGHNRAGISKKNRNIIFYSCIIIDPLLNVHSMLLNVKALLNAL